MTQDFEYPAWFLRVYTKTKEPELEDFDEDLSDIGGTEPPEYDFEREPDHKYDAFFTFHSLREERKERLKDGREHAANRQAVKEGQIEKERAKRAKVQVAYEAMAKAEEDGEDLTIDPEIFYQNIYNLYCPEYTEWTFERLLLHGDAPGFLELRVVDMEDEELEINGNLVIDRFNMSEHMGHAAQTTAGTAEHRISLGPNEGNKDLGIEVNLTEDTGEWDFGLVIIGEDNVLVRVSREFVFRAVPEGPPSGAPEVFEFWGISRKTDR